MKKRKRRKELEDWKERRKGEPGRRATPNTSTGTLWMRLSQIRASKEKYHVHSLHNGFGLARAKDADDPIEDFQPMSRLHLVLHKLMRCEMLKLDFEGIACHAWSNRDTSVFPTLQNLSLGSSLFVCGTVKKRRSLPFQTVLHISFLVVQACLGFFLFKFSALPVCLKHMKFIHFPSWLSCCTCTTLFLESRIPHRLILFWCCLRSSSSLPVILEDGPELKAMFWPTELLNNFACAAHWNSSLDLIAYCFPRSLVQC